MKKHSHQRAKKKAETKVQKEMTQEVPLKYDQGFYKIPAGSPIKHVEEALQGEHRSEYLLASHLAETPPGLRKATMNKFIAENRPLLSKGVAPLKGRATQQAIHDGMMGMRTPAKYRELNLGDTLEESGLKEGSTIVAVSPNGLMPNGQLRSKSHLETEQEYHLYCDMQFDKVFEDEEQTAEQIARRIYHLYGVDPQDPTLKPAFLSDVSKMVSAVIRARLEKTKPGLKREDIIRVMTLMDKGEIFNDNVEVAKILKEKYLKWDAETTFKLEPNDCSRTHKLIQAAKDGAVYEAFRKDKPTSRQGQFEVSEEHIFIVKHDWRAVLGDTNPELAEWEAPFDLCSFEFRISGRTVIASVDSTKTNKIAMLFIEWDKDFWLCFDADTRPILNKWVMEQIAACCVVMEAEVATHEVIRQPTALNDKRRKSGKVPLYDFHLIDLSRKRPKIANPTEGHSGTHHRLHFVRGHWRQYPTHRTRIPWHLRGDPELGFVDKMYKL